MSVPRVKRPLYSGWSCKLACVIGMERHLAAARYTFDGRCMAGHWFTLQAARLVQGITRNQPFA